MPLGGGTALPVRYLKAYQKSKDSDLANAIDQVRAVARDGMNREIKIAYQNYKVKYDKFVASSKQKVSLKASPRRKQAEDDIASMYPNEVQVIEQVYDGTPNPNGGKSQVEQWNNSVYPDVNQFNLTAAAIGSAYGIIADPSLKLKLKASDQEFDPAKPGPTTEVAAMKPFDRIRLRQEVTAAVLKKKAQLNAMTNLLRNNVDRGRRDNMRAEYNKLQPLPSFHPPK